MKKVLKVLGIICIIIVACSVLFVGCCCWLGSDTKSSSVKSSSETSDTSTSEKQPDTENLNLKVLDNEYCTVTLIGYDDDTGYFTFDIKNNSSVDIDFTISEVVIDKEYTASTGVYETIIKGTKTTASDNVYDDDDYTYFAASKKHNYDFKISVTDDENYNWSKDFNFEISYKDLGY